ELRQRFPQLVFRDVVVLDQDLFDGRVVDARAADGRLDVFLGDDAFVDQDAELRRLRLPRGAMLVVEGNSKDAGDLFGGILVERRENRSVAFVDELQDAEEVLFENDGNRQDRLRSKSALLVPALIEAQIR